MVLSFPLVGEDHPLRRHAAGILFKSALLSMFLHAVFAGGRMFVAGLFPPQVEFVKPGFITPILLQPHPIHEEPRIPIRVPTVPVTAPPDAIPEPVRFDPEIDVNAIPFSDASSEFEPADSSPGSGADPDENIFAAAPDSSIYEEGCALCTPPELISIPMPEYPEFARDAGVQGDVLLKVKVGVDGRVTEIQVLEGVPMLNKAAIEAASRALFRPAQHDQHLVPAWVVLPVRFTLQE
ncbi:MAG TPA: TonB family protein [bacterium]|nr:TonB family protein [bacterium]